MQRQYNNYKEQCKRIACIGRWKYAQMEITLFEATRCNLILMCVALQWCVGALSSVLFLVFFLYYFALFWFALFCFDFCLCRIDTKHTVWIFKTLDMIRFCICVCVSVVQSLFAFVEQKKCFWSLFHFFFYSMSIIKKFFSIRLVSFFFAFKFHVNLQTILRKQIFLSINWSCVFCVVLIFIFFPFLSFPLQFLHHEVC